MLSFPYGSSIGGIIDLESAPYNVTTDVANATANTTAINQAMADCVSGNKTLFVRNFYPINGPLTWPGQYVSIQGVNAQKSGFKCTGNAAGNYDILTIGQGSGTNDQSGFVRDIRVAGDYNTTAILSAGTAGTPKATYAALKISGLRFVELRNLYTTGAMVGYDFDNNCYGVSCHSLHGGTLSGSVMAIGMRLRGPNAGSTIGDGNDFSFYNCWITGKTCAIWADPNGGGYHFHGGQLSGGDGNSASNDLYGAINAGQNYYDGTYGGVGPVTLTSVSFEGTVYIWAVRLLGPDSRFDFNGCGFHSANSANAGMGVIKGGINGVIGTGNAQVSLRDCGVSGYFASTKPVYLVNDFGQTGYVGGTQPNLHIIEENTTGLYQMLGDTNDTSQQDARATGGLLVRSGINRGSYNGANAFMEEYRVQKWSNGVLFTATAPNSSGVGNFSALSFFESTPLMMMENTIMADQPVAFYRCASANGGTGTAEFDRSGSGQTGNYLGTTTYAPSANVPNGPFQKYGSCGSTGNAGNSGLNSNITTMPSGGFTVELWQVYFSHGTGVYSVLGNSDPLSTNKGFRLYTDSAFHINLAVGSGTSYTNGYYATALGNNVPYHFMITFDGTMTWKVYLNGVLVITVTQAYNADTLALYFGNDPTNLTASESFNMSMCAVIPSVLTARRALQRYNLGYARL